MSKQKSTSSGEREAIERLNDLLKLEAGPEPEAEPEPEPEPEPESEAQVEPELESESAAPAVDDDAPYTTGEWGGMTQWKCKLCPWDTLKGEAAMLEHIATKHKPPAPKLSILVADKYGNPK
jgi:hypothetical protein